MSDMTDIAVVSKSIAAVASARKSERAALEAVALDVIAKASPAQLDYVDMDKGVCFLPLIDAISLGREKIFNALIDAGANVKAFNPVFVGYPLHAACLHNKPDFANRLLEKGAQPDARNHFGETPLMLAAERNALELAQTLLHFGAHVNDYNPKGKRVLMYAATADTDSLELAEMLLLYGADASQKSEGLTALDIARSHGQLRIVARLDKSAPQNVPPLQQQPVKDDMNDVDVVLGIIWEIADADEDALPGLEKRALAVIAKASQEQLDSYYPDTAQNPLIAALDADNIVVLKALIKAGAKLDYADEDNEATVLDMARDKPDMHAVLLAAGAKPYHQPKPKPRHPPAYPKSPFLR